MDIHNELMGNIRQGAARKITMAIKKKRVGVECRFMEDGKLMVKAIQIDSQWHYVEQGRQWVDAKGRHILILLPDEQAAEIRLRPDTFNWELIQRSWELPTVV